MVAWMRSWLAALVVSALVAGGVAAAPANDGHSLVTPVLTPVAQEPVAGQVSTVPLRGLYSPSAGDIWDPATAWGIQGTGFGPPSGGTGLLGFLSGIYHAESGTLSVSGSVTATQGTAGASPWEVSPADLSASGSVTSAATLFTQDTSGFGELTFVLTSVGSGNTETFEESADNSNWETVPCRFAGGFTTAASATFTTNVGPWNCPLYLHYARLRTSTYGSGTVTAVAILKAAGVHTTYTIGNFGGGVTDQLGAVFAIPSASGGNSVCSFIAAASTNANFCKASAGQVYVGVCSNPAAYAVTVRLFNKASAPTVGTDTPVFRLLIPAGATVALPPDALGYAFATGIAYDATKLFADSDTTVLVAGDVACTFGYT